MMNDSRLLVVVVVVVVVAVVAVVFVVVVVVSTLASAYRADCLAQLFEVNLELTKYVTKL